MCSTVSGSSSFHLEWNNHLGNMQTVLETLYTQQSLVDVTVACKDGVLKAHKVILSACSPYFEAVFQETPCKHPVLILKGVNVREMQALLRFMYCGQVDVPEAELSALVATACEFKVKGFAMENIPGMDEFRPETASEHDSEGETSHNYHTKVLAQSWKEHKQVEIIAQHNERLSSVNNEVDVTPVIVESQSLQNIPSEHPSIMDQEQKEEDGQEEEEKQQDIKQESVASLKSSKVAFQDADGSINAGTDGNGNANTTANSTNSIATDNQSVSNSASANNEEATPFRRETRYKGQKRVDVGIRPPAGRARSVDKPLGVETRSSSSYSSSQSTKKLRIAASTRKTDLGTEAEQNISSMNQMDDKKMILESSTVDISISKAGSSTVEDVPPLPFVKIKLEAESADEDEEATADMFCISHLQELPETDGVDTSVAREELDVSAKWPVNPEATSSGREQRAVVESPAAEGEGDMACPYCFTRCPRFSDLKRHMRLHTEDKPHECEFCSLAFARASHLARHRRTHTGERPFRCPAPACDRTFSRQDKLKLHTQRAHPGLPCDLVQSGTYMRIRGRRRIRDKNLPPSLRLGLAQSSLPTKSTSASSSQSAVPPGPAIISLPFGDTSYLTSLSLGQQRYSDLTISPVNTVGNIATGGSIGSAGGAGAEELLRSVRQLGECTIQTLPSKILAE